MYATHCLNRIRTAIRFHQDIPYGMYGCLDMALMLIMWKKNLMEVTQKLINRKQSFVLYDITWCVISVICIKFR